MPTLIINGKKASIHQEEWAHFHGHSVFTTLRSYQCKPLLWKRHWSRLNAHAQFFGYTIPDEKTIFEQVLCELAGPLEQKIRIIIAHRHYALTFEPYEPPPPSIYDGVTTIISTMRPHPQLATFKTGNYLPYAMALKEAKNQGAFEALMLDEEGHLIDGARSSIMSCDGKSLVALDGGLQGCMREEVLEYAHLQGIIVGRQKCKLQQISGQLMLANSLMGVVPVGNIAFDMVYHLVKHFQMNAYSP
jgi:4-amino-4-deoxychorismate lyase